MRNKQPQKISGSHYPDTLESHYFFLIFCISTIFLVFIPLLLFIGALSNEALSLYQWGRDAGVGLQIYSFLQKSPLVTQIQTYLHGLGLNFEPAQLTDTLSSFIKTGGLFLYNQASSWAANILKLLALFCMMILIIFSLLIDQRNLVAFFIRLSPLPDHEDCLLLAKFEKTANAILKGTIVCGLIQGIIIGIVFAIFGLNASILWGCIMAVVACLPIPGIGLVIIIPTAMILAINGQPETGIILSLFYMVLSFSIEYVIKPKMVGGQVKMHTLLVFLSLMVGLTVYGVLGIIYGPLIITAFLTLLDLYLARYDSFLQTEIIKKPKGLELTGYFSCEAI